MVFETIFKESNDLESFGNSLRRNYQAVADLYEMSYRDQQEQRDSIEKFILLKKKIISAFSYSDTESRSFVLILLDFCERFCLYSCIPHIIKIIKDNGIEINKRMEAGMKTIIPRPTSNQDLVNRFDDICILLNNAIEEEEDNEKLSLVTLLNYYDHIVINTNAFCIKQINEKLTNAIEQNAYSWISSLEDILDYNSSDIDSFHLRIEEKIDDILDKGNNVKSTSIPADLLIETGTDYSQELTNISNHVLSVRQINVNHAKGTLHGRGVNQLGSEEEMFEYMKRYGKMHYAKLMSSFEEPFPQNFNEHLDVIDWGCGQALATMAFIEKYGDEFINTITLVEPSEIVIKRAALHCRKFAPHSTIHTICKKLDEIKSGDFNLNCQTRIHLFSNILDIDDYRINHLTTLVDELLSNKDYFVCVSPYIDDIKSAKVQSFMNHFDDVPSFTIYHDRENTKQGPFWACNNTFGHSMVSHGTRYGCKNYDNNGCQNKWTRVEKVFSV